MPQLLSVTIAIDFIMVILLAWIFHIWSVFLFSDRDISSIPQETALVIQRLIRYNDITFWEIFPSLGQIVKRDLRRGLSYGRIRCFEREGKYELSYCRGNG